MKNDFDFIKDRIDESGVNAPAHMDEGYVLHQLDGVQPKDAPEAVTAAEDKPKVVQIKPKRHYGRITSIAAAVVAVTVLGTALTVHFTKQPAAPAVSQPTGLIQFETREQVQEAIEKLSSRNARYTGYAVSDEEYGAAERDMNFAPAVSPDGAASGSGGDSGKGSVSGSLGASSGSASAVGEQTAGSDSHSETYKQVDGVDEGDIIKTDGRYIYVAEYSYNPDTYDDSSCVCVFPAKPGVTDPILRIVPGENYAKPLSQSTVDEATPDETAEPTEPSKPDDGDDLNGYDHLYINEFYIKDGRLILLCSCYSYTGYFGGYGYGSVGVTRAYVYDAADMENVRLLDTFTQSGSYTSSRMIGDTLYIVTNEYDMDGIPVCGRGETPDEMYPSCIYSVEDPYEESFLIVSSYDTLDRTASTDSKAVLGLGSDIYCSEDNLYIAAADYSRYYRLYEVDYGMDSVITYGADEEDDEDDFETIKTKIFKVSLSGGVSFTAYGEVEGTTNNQYSFDEHDGYLRVATTSWNEDYEEINNLYVLDGSLNIVGSVTGFAETESIKAVRYVGDTAYVITYEQTDPLFVIDLSSPTAPTILGEVKISGFSTMLVPVDDDTILGLGINTGEYDYTTMEVQDGFKLALFDVSDKAAPQVLDSRAYVDYSSAVMHNPRALVYNPERGDYLVPLSYYHYNTEYDNPEYGDDDDVDKYWDIPKYEQYGAVLNFRVEGGKIVETELYITDHDEIDRCVYVGDTIYMTYTDDNGAAHLDSVSYR